MRAPPSEPLAALRRTIADEGSVLFTGAGFSLAARDRRGRHLPSSEELRRELWSVIFGDEPIDDSSLSDLFDVALRERPDEVARLLDDRLTVGDGPLPPHYAAWLSAPWRRVYTLNVDDLEVAVARQVALPRRLEVVHLNGRVGDDLDRVTFSTLQYAQRLWTRQHAYEALEADLAEAPFVFVGTSLDEIALWQCLLPRTRTERSFLLSPAMPRARQALLRRFRIEWIPARAEDVLPVG